MARDREFDNRDQHFRNRTERYQHALGLVKHLHLYKTKLGLNQTGASLSRLGACGVGPVLTHDVCMCVCTIPRSVIHASADMRLLTEEALTEFLPTMLHEIAFVPFIRSQASPEQVQKWLPLAEQYVRAHARRFISIFAPPWMWPNNSL